MFWPEIDEVTRSCCRLVAWAPGFVYDSAGDGGVCGKVPRTCPSVRSPVGVAPRIGIRSVRARHPHTSRERAVARVGGTSSLGRPLARLRGKGVTQFMRVLVADDDRTALTILSGLLEEWQPKCPPPPTASPPGSNFSSPIRRLSPSSTGRCPGWTASRSAAASAQIPRPPISTSYSSPRADGRADSVEGLDAGADDYVTKPFDLEELRARVQVGIRVARLQDHLSDRIAELQDALSRVKQLSGLLPICSYCKRIRSDSNYWEQVESYIAHHSDARFSHGICPPCYENVMVELDAERDALKAQGGT